LNEDLSPIERLQKQFDQLVLRPRKHVVWYRCLICGNRFGHDGAGLSPVCTGPHASLDEHPHEPMVREP